MSDGRRLFYSPLGRRLRDYLEFKKRMGFTSFSRTYAAQDFDRYLLFRGVASARDINEGLVVAWVHVVSRHAAVTKNGRLRFARGFLDYLVRVDELSDNPARRIPYLRQKVHKPYIYTLDEIHRILEAARAVQRAYSRRLTGWTMETFVFLLYACGLRLGEALKLNIEDVDFEEGTLSLWNTKFHKERLVPFSPAVGRKLQAYLACRSQALPARPGDPFFAHPGGRYCKSSMHARFQLLLRRAGVASGAGRGGPRLHDLRHTMAVHRLYKWYQEGHDILNKLPLLSTFMGHVNIENTQVYLTITRALLREGDRRFQAGFEAVTDKALRRAVAKP